MEKFMGLYLFIYLQQKQRRRDISTERTNMLVGEKRKKKGKKEKKKRGK